MTERSRWLAPLVAALVFLFAPRAWAIEYEIFIDVDDENDLFELNTTEQISDSTYVTLVDLMRRGTNLDEATREELYALPNLTYADVDRILAYRKEAGHIRDPAVLVSAGVLDRKLLASLAAFIVIGEESTRKAPVSGFVQYQTVWTSRDRRAPPMILQARVNTLKHLTIGMAGQLNRNRLGEVRWDPNRDAFTAQPNRTRPQLTKAFIQWDTPKFGAILGSYRIGFGQKLTFDNSGRYTPNGFFLDDSYYRRVKSTRLCKESAGELDETPCDTNVYGTPDYRFRYGLLGAAVGAKHLSVGDSWFQLYGFFSYQPRDIYQYMIDDRNVCDDPSSDAPECSAPKVYKAQDDPLAETSTYSYQTLPNMFALALGGGNFSWFHDRRTHVGVTGYGASPRWLVAGAKPDFADYAPLPYGGAFGAVGVDASWGRRWADLFAEVSRSFDHQDGLGGGFAGILRATATWDVHEVEVSARYYDTKFVNPFARPIAGLDVNAGLRASDEAGGRIRYSALLAKRLVLRTFLDVWTNIASKRPELRTYVRADFEATKWFSPGLWVTIQDRDTRNYGGAAESFCSLQDNGYASDANDAVTEDDPSNQNATSDVASYVEGCTGERYTLQPRMRFTPHDRVSFLLQYRHSFTEDTDYPNSVRHDGAAYFMISARPIDRLLIRSRFRFFDNDLQNNLAYERSVWAYLELSYRVARWLTPRVRYDVYARIDDRPSTQARVPVPEHWLWFELESRF